MEVEITFYLPKGVKKFLAIGSNCFIGIVNDTTVLKYPHIRDDKAAIASLSVEAQIFKAIGPHDRIIGFKGETSSGLLLERAAHGSVAQYLSENNPTTQQRLRWAIQAAEATAVVHQRNVIHRDIHVRNLLLDAELNVKLCDFQGRLLRPDGSIERDGGSCENIKSTMPQVDPNNADSKTDIFALGSALYYIMEGHEPFPELDSIFDEQRITENFASGQFPELQYFPMRKIIYKCWRGEYDSAENIVRDIVLYENDSGGEVYWG